MEDMECFVVVGRTNVIKRDCVEGMALEIEYEEIENLVEEIWKRTEKLGRNEHIFLAMDRRTKKFDFFEKFEDIDLSKWVCIGMLGQSNVEYEANKTIWINGKPEKVGMERLKKEVVEAYVKRMEDLGYIVKRKELEVKNEKDEKKVEDVSLDKGDKCISIYRIKAFAYEVLLRCFFDLEPNEVLYLFFNEREKMFYCSKYFVPKWIVSGNFIGCVEPYNVPLENMKNSWISRVNDLILDLESIVIEKGFKIVH